jgi:RNA polymerase sigma-70 factor (ECF subfamily)
MGTAIPNDEELMLAAGRGDLAAFQELVLRHQRSAWSAAYRFLGDAGEAEDAAQETFLKILDAAPRYTPSATFRTYLYRVVSRVCLDRVRRKRPLVTDDLPAVVDGSPTPAEALAASERDARVRAALDRLPPKQRLVLVLRHYEGQSYREIAAAMGLTEKAVEHLLARAVAALEQALKEFLK